MPTTPPKMPRYVQAVSAKGRTYLYFRHRGRRTQLPSDPTSTEFFARYAELLAGTGRPGRKSPAAGSLAALMADYKNSPEFTRLAPKTRHYYARQLDQFAPIGHFPASTVSRAAVLKIRDHLAPAPRTADQFIQVACRLFSWAVNRHMLERNPATNVDRINNSVSYEPWPAEAIRRFRASRPSPAIMTAFMLANYASPRRGDVLSMTRAQYDGAGLIIRQAKTGQEHYVPCHQELKRYLDALPIRVGLLVPNPQGKAWDPSAFSKAFRAHSDSIGLTGLHFHGLRHACATALAEAGCSEKEIMAITGHTTPGMVKRYTQKVEQKHLARSAMAKLERNKNAT